ncbi:MAG: L-lactate dehydrogenase, partial [Dermatophilaceae bacterium]|nr:L-lactate dehydrogenase [Dermatophilaceae bacterium]
MSGSTPEPVRQRRRTKVGIVGAGAVGATLAYATL